MGPPIDHELLRVFSERVSAGLQQVRATIDSAGMDPESITIIGVTKGWGPEAVLAGLANGLTWFGENYADELVAKAAAVEATLERGTVPRTANSCGPKWTFQGKLQSNKINRLKNVVALWQTVDSVERAQALGSRVPGADVFVQVVLHETRERSGCTPDELPMVLQEASLAGLRICGLMGVAPDSAVYGFDATERAFAQIKRLADTHGLGSLSIGMSDDYAVALAHGATHLRLGSLLFGQRS